MIITTLALVATMATCSSVAAAKSKKDSTTPPHSVWSAGDYIGRDPDLAIRAAMIRELHNH